MEVVSEINIFGVSCIAGPKRNLYFSEAALWSITIKDIFVKSKLVQLVQSVWS